MPTATADRGWRLLVVVPVLVAVAIGTFVALRSRSSESSTGGAAVDGPGTEAVVPVSAASIYDFGSLDELVEASDLIVRGRVEAASRGRAVGSDANAIVSRIVTLRVEEVLAGSVATPSVLVEEEGWLVDGRPLEVNGLGPSHEGMEAIWFLDALPPGELPGYLVINHQGRYVLDGDRLEGAGDAGDPLVAEVEALGAATLVAEVRRIAATG